MFRLFSLAMTATAALLLLNATTASADQLRWTHKLETPLIVDGDPWPPDRANPIRQSGTIDVSEPASGATEVVQETPFVATPGESENARRTPAQTMALRILTRFFGRILWLLP